MAPLLNALHTAAGVALTLLAAALLLMALYLTVLTLAALVARRRLPARRPPRSATAPPPRPPLPAAGGVTAPAPLTRFAVLIPAHDEELLIGRLLDNLAALDYPADRFEVNVVADNCEDATAAVARAHGARVFERSDPDHRSKGHALRWLLENLKVQGNQTGGQRYDAYVVLDADSVVGPDFLRVMDDHLRRGSQVVQAYYTVLNAAESPVAALRYAALAAVHYLRPLGRSQLGLSCGLKGNGMCFAAPVLERFAWSWYTLAEDVEFHLALVDAGIRVDFAPRTTVLADMPVTLAQAESQNERWERGRLQLLRSHAPALLRAGLPRLFRPGQGGPMRLDAVLEQLVPPLSVPFALAGLCLLAGALLQLPLLLLLAGASLAGQVSHLLVAMALAGAPRRAYLALAYAPVYVAWKVGLYARALAGRSRLGWVRTARTAGPA